MENNSHKLPPVVSLTYKKGDFIIKEGDYGIAVYMIKKGSVEVFTYSGEQKVPLYHLGPGEIIGELTFFSKEITTRSASAVAAEDCELEAWHPEMLSPEYEDMPYIIKHLTYELLNRRIRMNRFIVQMVSQQEEPETDEKGKTLLSKRLFYRKEVNLLCTYRPIDLSSKLRLNGRIRDISMTGANLETRGKTATNFPHDPGEEIYLDITMPNGKEIHLTARILSPRKPRFAGTLSFGLIFTDMREGSKKELGFFLMP